MVYSPFFQTLYDETRPVGILGRGTHYSVLRAATWHDSFLQPLSKAELLDFAVIWDEDHDARVMQVVETIYFDGLLAPIRFIGERKGGLTVLVAMETASAGDLAPYSERVEEAVRRTVLDDWWNVAVDYVGNEGTIINAEPEKVAVYLQNINNLWCLGIKPRPEQGCTPDAPDDSIFDSDDVAVNQFCRTLTANELSPACRRWRGDDQKGGNRHHGAIPLSESPVDIELRWRESENAATKLVGYYRLDLHALLSEGNIRRDSKPGHVRVQFVHDGDDIYIQHRADKRVRVGGFA